MSYLVLVVNDDPDNLQMFRDVLEYSGYQATTREQPDDLVPEVVRMQPDVIILDWVYGREELGLQVIDDLLTSDLPQPPSLIVCSAAVRQVKDIEATLVGKGVQVLYKPFEMQTLQHALKLATVGLAGRSTDPADFNRRGPWTALPDLN